MNVVNIGNILVKPLDPILLGMTFKNNFDVTCKALNHSPDKEIRNIFLSKQDVFRVFSKTLFAIKKLLAERILYLLPKKGKDERQRRNSNNFLSEIGTPEKDSSSLFVFPENFENIVLKVDFLDKIVSNPEQRIYQELINK